MKRSKIVEALATPVRIIMGIPLAFRISNEESYSPDLERKNILARVRDNVLWLIKYREPNRFYNLYGFDLKNAVINQKEYINYLTFAHQRDEKNLLGDVRSQVILLRDKLLFYKYMVSSGMPVPNVFAAFINGKMYDTNLNVIKEDSILLERDYFVKELDGECASFVIHISDYEDYLNKKAEIRKHNCIFQRRIIQAPEMSIINPLSINTLRIITVYNNGQPYVFSALLRVGTKETGNVDNWAKGGLAIGIEKDGCLKKYGYYKPHFGGKTDFHPDSLVKFSEFCVPQYESACKAACEAHRVFYNIATIGWDVAITSDGPMFIEGNDNWEISLNQVVDNGLKTKWIKAMKD